MNTTKKQFPLLHKNQRLVYLDNAASTQTCAPALTAMNDYYKKYRANIHRSIYDIGAKATEQYETARDQVAHFINAKREEIIFTSGTTFGLNQLAYSLSPRLSHRDNVVLTRLEHHANLVPWQQMAKHYGFKIRFIELTKSGEIDVASAKKLIDANTKIVSFALVSNVLGTVAPTKELIKLAKAHRAITIIDAAQAVAHLPIDVRKLDCDFLVFSGHKMYGPTGIGVLYGKKTLLDEHLEPFLFGGDMIDEVSYDGATWAELPNKFEAGTPNIAGAIGLGAAAEFIVKTGWKKIQAHEHELITYALKKLSSEVTIICHSERSAMPTGRQEESSNKRIGTITFTIPGIHPHDVAEILNQDKICIRAGLHCAEPLHRQLGLTATARASFGIYNEKTDVDRLVIGIKKIKKMFV